MFRKVGFFLLLFPAVCFGQDVPLEIKGGAPQTVLTSLPFTVQAPVGGIIYQWQVPTGLTATTKNDRLEITAAAKGSYTVSVSWVSIDFKNQVVTSNYGQVAFNIGEVTPGPGPNPPPPATALTKLLQEALVKNGGPTPANLDTAKKLAVAAKQVANTDMKSFKAISDVTKAWGDAYDAQKLVSGGFNHDAQVLFFTVYAKDRFPTSNAILTDAVKTAIASAFTEFASSLESLK
jgi:hypothetical protein